MAIKNYNDKHEDVINPYLTHKQAQKLREKLKLKQLKEDVANAGRSDEAKENIRRLLSNPTSRVSYTFNNYVSKKQQDFFGTEFTEFSAWPNQKIIHGVITISEFDSKGNKIGEKSDDIYMYQPRFEGKDRFFVGPRYRSDGTLNNRAAYAYKDIETGIVYVGSIPKREIISNRKFDFDKSNMDNFNATLKETDITHRKVTEVVSIKYDKNPNTGYIRSVNLNNPQEKAKLERYYKKYPTAAKADDMIDSYIHRIEREVSKFEKITEEIEESVARVGIAKNAARIAAEEAQEEAREVEANKPLSLSEQNAQMINNLIRYGVRPTLSSPIDDGIGGLEIGRPTPPPMPHHHEGQGRHR